jgi:hypothetical protein
MGSTNSRPRPVRELIIECWQQLDREFLGASELQEIQRSVQASGLELAPSLIARTLADVGVRLRHPEVIDCDALWRAQQFTETSWL